MKRQHPTDPNLFWCPQCNKQKPLTDEYWARRGDNNEKWIYSKCRQCLREYKTIKAKEYYKINPDKFIKAGHKWKEKNREKTRQFSRDWFVNNREKRREYVEAHRDMYSKASSKCCMKERELLTDPYIRRYLKKRKEVETPQIIELIRQRITMKRTLKEFKQWRKEQENEPNYTDVYGKQFTDEENHEGRV